MAVAATRFVARLMITIAALALSISAPAQVTRTDTLTAISTSEALTRAVDGKGYHVKLDEGWTADFWFAKELKTAKKDVPGALYPELANGEFVGLVNLPRGITDFRGQVIPTGVYTLRYQLLPQDGNHLGVAPNPDFLLAIPVASDPEPERDLAFKKLVALSSKATGANHPGVIALDTAGEPGSVAKDQNLTVFSVGVPTAGGASEKLGIVVKGTAPQ